MRCGSLRNNRRGSCFARFSRMSMPLFRAVFLVICAVSVSLGAQSERAAMARMPAELAELWETPANLEARDLFNGPGGPELAPQTDATFTWVASDTSGFSPGFDVSGPDGRPWSVKLGLEAQSEVVASRILWAIGFHQPPTYYLPAWQLSGGPGGAQPAARFRTDFDGWKTVGEWSWSKNEFIDTQPYRGLIVANILLNSWDWKKSNNRIYRDARGMRRFVVRDLGASLGKTSSSKLLLVVPMRGFGQGSRNDIEGFESQGFIERVGKDRVEFDFHTIYGSIVDLVRPSDVKIGRAHV